MFTKLITNKKAVTALFILIAGIFFYKTFLFGLIPFPGDLLLSEYAPFRHTSYGGYNPGSVPSKAQYFDVIVELYPWKTLVIDELKHGRIPLWNPHNFSGTPLLANHQSQAFYPLNIFYFIFPQHIAWTILIILQPLLGSIFFYLFATLIGLSPVPAILGAILFNYSSFATVWLEFNTVWHTILWLPLMLYVVEFAARKEKMTLGHSLVLIFALVSTLTGGHPQDAIYSILFVTIYSLCRIRSGKRKLQLALLAAFSFGLAAPQLLPTIELFMTSARVPHDVTYVLTSMLIQLWQLPMLLVQDYFGNPATRSYWPSDSYVTKAISIGSIGFFTAIGALGHWKQSWFIRFYAITAAFILLTLVYTPLSAIFYAIPIPLLSTGTPTRSAFLLIFCLAVLAAFGLEQLITKKQTSVKYYLFIGAVMVGLWIFSFTHEGVSTRSLILSTALVGLFLLLLFVGNRIKLASVIIVLLVMGELWYGFTKFNPFVPSGFVFPDNPVLAKLSSLDGVDRHWGYGTAAIAPNIQTQYKLYSTDGIDPLNLASFNSFIQSSKDGKIATTFTRSTRSDARIEPGYGEDDLPNNHNRLRLLDALGVKYILDRVENPKNNTTFHPNRFTELAKIDDWIIYENTLAAPRFFLTHSVDTYENDADFEQKFFSPTFQPAVDVLVPKTSALPSLVQTDNKDIDLLSYDTSEVHFRTTTDTPQLLYLSDVYTTDWSAYVDNVRTPIITTNYAFRGIIVPAGDHTILFRYESKAFLYGIFIFVASAMGILLYVTVQKYYHFSRGKSVG